MVERDVGVEDEGLVEVEGEGFSELLDLVLGFGGGGNIDAALEDTHGPGKVLLCVDVVVGVGTCCGNLESQNSFIKCKRMEHTMWIMVQVSMA